MCNVIQQIQIQQNNNIIRSNERTIKQFEQQQQMSSLEDDIFFGSKQHILDSYLKAREEEERSGLMLGEKNVVYPNILDDISYQPSFKHESSANIIKRGSVISIKSEHNKITQKIYIWIEKLWLHLDSVKEGACLEINCSLGDDQKITEYIFYSRINSNNKTISRQSYEINQEYSLHFVNQTVSDYFTQKKIRNLSFQIINKQSVYDKKVGNAFLPIESIISCIEDALLKGNKEKVKKEIRLKMITSVKGKKIVNHHEEQYITFWLCLGKVPRESTELKKMPVTTEKTAQQLLEKRNVKLYDLQIKQEQKNFITITFNNRELSFEETRLIDIEKSNKLLKEGIIFEVLIKGIHWGKIRISALHVFLQDSLKGKYPIEINETHQCAGFITIEFNEPLIMPKQPTNNTQEKNKGIPQMNTKKVPKNLTKAKTLLQTCISTKRIYAYGQKFSKESRYYVLCYYRNNIKKSKEFKFEECGNKVPFLYQSQEPIEFIFSQSQYTTVDQQSKVEWEFYCREIDYDRIYGFSQFSVNWSKETEYVVNFRHFGLDCSVTDPHVIIKLDTTVGMLRYEEGYFVEEKIDALLRLFRWDVRQPFITEYQNGLYKESNSLMNFKETLRKRIDIPFIQLEKFIQLTDFQQKGFQSQFIKGFIEPLNISTIKITSIPQFIKELHYLDNLYTGYVSLQELKLVFKYYNKQKVEQQEWWNVNVQNKRLLLLVDPEFDIIKKDFVIKKRGFYEKKKIMFNYVPFLAFLEEVKELEEDQHEQKEKIEQLEIQNKGFEKKWEEAYGQELLITVIRAKNLNRISGNLKSPNSFIRANHDENSQTFYRDNNPEYNYRFRARGDLPIKFSIYHRDIRQGCQRILAELEIPTQKLRKAIARKEHTIIININPETSVEIGLKKGRLLESDNMQ